MARNFIEKITDDLDGTQIPEGEDSEVSFGLDNVDYAIDLNQKNAEALRESLAPYIAVARHSARAGKRQKAKRQQNNKAELDAIRTWARENGHEVSARGPIPKSVTAAYQEATASV